MSLVIPEVTIALGAETLVLKPTLDVAIRLSDELGGYAGIWGKVQTLDLAGYAAVIRIGAGLPASEAQRILAAVWMIGPHMLRQPVTDFAALVLNGGKPLSDTTETQEGNDAAAA
jgi:hypothetical protein